MGDKMMLQFRSDLQMEECRAIALECGITLSEWVRRACEEYAEREFGRDVRHTREGFVPRAHCLDGCASAEIMTSPEYRALWAAKQRCTNPRAAGHAYYKAKGICVHPDWCGPDGFSRFVEHVGLRPSPKHSLDRIDNSRGYEPGNVRWATGGEQIRNTSRTRLLTLNGETLCLKDWAGRYGLRENTLRSRLQRGVELAEALTMPKGLRKGRAA